METSKALICSLCSLATGAHASVNVQNFIPAANSTYLLTEDALLHLSPHISTNDSIWTGRRLYFSAILNSVNDPLVRLNPSRTKRTATLVDGINSLDLTVGWFTQKRMVLATDIPLHLVHLEGKANQFALGDSRIALKYRLTRDDAFLAASVIPEVRLPTGSSDLFVSNGSFTSGLSFAFERDFGPFRAATNIGYLYSPKAIHDDLNYKQKLPLSLGIFAPMSATVGINAEASGALSLPINRFNNPGEFYLGLRSQVSKTAVITGGGAIGRLGGIGGNDFRLVVGIKLTPMSEEVPIPAVAATAPKPPKPIVKRVEFTPKKINISEEVKFEHASAVLTPAGKNLLDEVSGVITANRKNFKKIMVEGHTNEMGGMQLNQFLSESRANSVKEYLTSTGIDANVLGAMGFGKTKPKYLPKFSKKAQLEENRRVEFKVIN